MKKRLLCRFATIGTALLLSSITVIPAFAAQLAGHLDTVTANSITGWAWNAEAPNEYVSVEITISGGEGPGANTFTTTQALLPREDLQIALGSANHGFTCEVDWTKLTGDTFTVSAAAVSGDEKTPLIGSFTVSKEALLAAQSAAVSTDQASQIPEAVQNAMNAEPAETKTVSADEIPADKIPFGPGFAGSSLASESPAATKVSTTPNASASANSTTETTGPKAETAEPGEFLGTFKASGYCNCQKCSGGYTKTYSGTIPQANHTISADLNVFPIGTKLVIDGITYTVEDRGSGVNGNRIDIYFASHAEALAFGLQTIDVYAPK